MAAIALLILAMGGVSLVGAWLIGAGFRGHPVPRHAACGGCRYDLSGHHVRPDACPECGSALGRLGAVRIVHRRWCKTRLALGGAIVLFAFSPTALVMLPKAATPAVPKPRLAGLVTVPRITGGFVPTAPATLRELMLTERFERKHPRPAPLDPIVPAPIAFDVIGPVPASSDEPTLDDGHVTIGGYGGLDTPGFLLLDVPPELDTWEQRRGALRDLPSGRNGMERWLRGGKAKRYPSVMTSRDGSHSRTLLRR